MEQLKEHWKTKFGQRHWWNSSKSCQFPHVYTVARHGLWQVFINSDYKQPRLLRSVVGYTKWDSKGNADIRKELDLKPLNEWVEEYRKR